MQQQNKQLLLYIVLIVFIGIFIYYIQYNIKITLEEFEGFHVFFPTNIAIEDLSQEEREMFFIQDNVDDKQNMNIDDIKRENQSIIRDIIDTTTRINDLNTSINATDTAMTKQRKEIESRLKREKASKIPFPRSIYNRYDGYEIQPERIDTQYKKGFRSSALECSQEANNSKYLSAMYDEKTKLCFPSTSAHIGNSTKGKPLNSDVALYVKHKRLDNLPALANFEIRQGWWCNGKEHCKEDPNYNKEISKISKTVKDKTIEQSAEICEKDPECLSFSYNRKTNETTFYKKCHANHKSFMKMPDTHPDKDNITHFQKKISLEKYPKECCPDQVIKQVIVEKPAKECPKPTISPKPVVNTIKQVKEIDICTITYDNKNPLTIKWDSNNPQFRLLFNTDVGKDSISNITLKNGYKIAIFSQPFFRHHAKLLSSDTNINSLKGGSNYNNYPEFNNANLDWYLEDCSHCNNYKNRFKKQQCISGCQKTRKSRISSYILIPPNKYLDLTHRFKTVYNEENKISKTQPLTPTDMYNTFIKNGSKNKIIEPQPILKVWSGGFKSGDVVHFRESTPDKGKMMKSMTSYEFVEDGFSAWMYDRTYKCGNRNRCSKLEYYPTNTPKNMKNDRKINIYPLEARSRASSIKIFYTKPL